MGSTQYDVTIIGGGIIGLATAMLLVREFPDLRTAVLEKEREIALHQTGHNSGVIHAGIYYAPGSDKASFSSAGGRMLREFCDERGIEYELCGKLIVATNEDEVPRLEDLFSRGTANGVAGLRMVDRDEIAEMEPHAAGVKGIHSPNTGIVDFTQVSRAYASELEQSGGEVLTGAELLGVVRDGGRLRLETSRGELTTRRVVNCAGLHVDVVARMMGAEVGARIIPFRGEYFTLRPERSGLVNGLVYPVPDPDLPFLGVHFTKRISGTIEAGPSAVLAFAREGYGRTSISLPDALGILAYPGFWRMSRSYWKTGVREQYRSVFKGAFVRSLQRLVPEVRGDDLYGRGSGVRAQAVDRRGRLLQDFSIAETEGAIHVLNAPSPGATASLSIGKRIVDTARESFELVG